MKFLFEQNIQSIIVEGGATLLNAFIKQNLWDEARIFIAKKLILSGLKAPAISGKTIKTIDFDNETLFIIVNHEKNSYYSDNITTDNLLLGTI
jgi:diaminohydroxyphosphoribosylaminopyrimidine deaminase/5-amino-6-(5-phosphoribosylamino)uracil reductase